MAERQSNILITGASGMVGSALGKALRERGYKVFDLSRTNPQADFYYDVERNLIHLAPSVELDAVFNFAGANISQRRWSRNFKEEIRDSRVALTRALARAVCDLPYSLPLFFSASAIGFYGDTGDETAVETSDQGEGFLADLSRDWESAAIEVQARRTVIGRFGLILSPGQGLLANMELPTGLLAAGPLGNGHQYMSWIALQDVVSFCLSALAHERVSGTYNLVAGEPISNREFSQTLARVLRRPMLPAMPAFLLKLLFGEMANEALLLNSRVVSQRLKAENLEPDSRDLESTLRGLYQRG